MMTIIQHGAQRVTFSIDPQSPVLNFTCQPPSSEQQRIELDNLYSPSSLKDEVDDFMTQNYRCLKAFIERAKPENYRALDKYSLGLLRMAHEKILYFDGQFEAEQVLTGAEARYESIGCIPDDRYRELRSEINHAIAIIDQHKEP